MQVMWHEQFHTRYLRVCEYRFVRVIHLRHAKFCRELLRGLLVFVKHTPKDSVLPILISGNMQRRDTSATDQNKFHLIHMPPLR